MEAREQAAYETALREAPKVYVDVNCMTGEAFAPYPEWLFQAGVEFGEAKVKAERERELGTIATIVASPDGKVY